MKRIFKYPLEITDRQVIVLPIGVKPLSVQMQNGQMCLWAEVDTAADSTVRTIFVFGTGNPMPEEPGEYISTVQDYMGLVWHVYIMEEQHV